MYYVVINLGEREQVMEPGYTNKAVALKARSTWRAMAAKGERHNIDIQFLPHYESEKVMAQFQQAVDSLVAQTPEPVRPSVKVRQHPVIQLHRQASIRRYGRPTPVHPHHRLIGRRVYRSNTEHLFHTAYLGGGIQYMAARFLDY